ncbi:sugar ABC transporter ATP-binding protein [Benzoatithermus flavus]|uniref:Sugar ABC transporter ATP-binding protein n=1 Tax=Benzoatithermus flavus TaxID=3108223 RepID=A0ABU8XR38_9PROT
MSEPFLRLTRVSKRFGGVLALDRIDWDVLPGEVHCLVGENGCGKSTLIKLVAGVHAPDPGSRIEIAGEVHEQLDPALAHRLGIQVIFQDLSLFPNLSVAENIAIDAHLGGLAKPVAYGRLEAVAQEVLSRLGFSLPLDAKVGSLPIAERQVVAICRGLAADARLLFMDEPTASLTRAEVRSLLAIVDRLKAHGIAVVFVSHRLDEVVEIAERVTVMRDGRKVGTYAAGEVDARRIGELMTGLSIEHVITARDMSEAPPLLEVRGLFRAGEYADVSFTLRRGEILGITGLLGAGRTELALSLFGMTRPDAGEIRLDGKPLALGSNQDAIRAGIAYVSEDRLHLGLNMRQSVADNLALASLDRLAGALGWVPPARRRSLAADWARRLKIKLPGLDNPVQQLSGGNQQRIVLAKWLATSPKVLILDSPTVGVDIGNKRGIYEIVHALAAEGVGILLISDEIPEVYYNADRVLHMREGRIVGEHVPGRIAEHALEEQVYA